MVYRLGSQTVIDHLGVVCSVISANGAGLSVEGEDPHVARRSAFDFLLARVGDHLDLTGLPRIYGLGLAGRDGAVLVMLPRGGGKTTLALRALREPGIRFFSEVSPLADRRGRLHPFPFPLWVRVNSPEAADLPGRYVRRMGGDETNPRLFEVEGFRERIARQPEPLRHIVIGERSLGRESRLEHLARSRAVLPLFRTVGRQLLADRRDAVPCPHGRRGSPSGRRQGTDGAGRSAGDSLSPCRDPGALLLGRAARCKRLAVDARPRPRGKLAGARAAEMSAAAGEIDAKARLSLLRRLTDLESGWFVWKNGDVAVAGPGDIDSAAERQAWPAIVAEFRAWRRQSA